MECDLRRFERTRCACSRLHTFSCKPFWRRLSQSSSDFQPEGLAYGVGGQAVCARPTNGTMMDVRIRKPQIQSCRPSLSRGLSFSSTHKRAQNCAVRLHAVNRAPTFTAKLFLYLPLALTWSPSPQSAAGAGQLAGQLSPVRLVGVHWALGVR